MAVVAATLAPGGLASAAKVTTVKDVSLTATGSLTYTWNGDPARGCAAVGVCGIRGELIMRPQSSGQSVSPGHGPVTINLDGSGVVRVVREDGGAAVGECVDLAGGFLPFLYFNQPARGATTTASLEPPPSSGRCAGPTGDDLARVPVAVRRTGRLSFDLAGTRTFTAGPFSGTLVSTVQLVPAPVSLGGETSSSSGSSGRFSTGGPGRPAAHPIFEVVRLRYRISAAPSAIETEFAGATGSSCQLLDACGTSGSLAFSVQPSRTVTVIAERQVHKRLSRREVLRDMRLGRLRLTAFELVAGKVSETFDWPNGSSCHDAVASPGLLLSTGSGGAPPAAGRTIPVTINANGGGAGIDVFRTHCPGPSDADLFGENANGGSQTYAHGVLTTAQLLARQSVLTLSDPGSFSGFGYTGSRTGSIVLDLTLTRVTAETQR